MDITSPTGQLAAASEPIATLVSFTTVEPGWIEARQAPDLGSNHFNVWAVIGWALWDISQGGETWREARAVSSHVDMFYYGEEDNGSIYFSRTLFREAQGGTLTLGKTQLIKAVSE